MPYKDKTKRAIYLQEWYKRNPEKSAYYAKNHRIKHPESKEYRKNHDLKRRFGITLAQYNQMLIEQNGVCFICHESETLNRSLSVDHDHATNTVCRLLCDRCNTTLGKVKDNINTLYKMIDYIKLYRPQSIS